MVDKDRTSTENDRYATNKQHTYQLTMGTKRTRQL
jgi:hypothetical protein